MLVVYPQRYQVQPQDWDFLKHRWSLKDDDFDLSLYNRRISSFCSERGIRCCDLVEPFRSAARERNLYLPGGDSHFNRQGHAVAAEAASRCILAGSATD